MYITERETLNLHIDYVHQNESTQTFQIAEHLYFMIIVNRDRLHRDSTKSNDMINKAFKIEINFVCINIKMFATLTYDTLYTYTNLIKRKFFLFALIKSKIKFVHAIEKFYASKHIDSFEQLKSH